jgi:hypothetical protein
MRFQDPDSCYRRMEREWDEKSSVWWSLER